MAFHFRAYELNFESVFESPAALYNNCCNAKPDIFISTGSVPFCLDTPTAKNDYFQTANQEFLLTIPDVARYHVQSGRHITVEPLSNADPDKVSLFLFGSAMGALLYQRGLFPLHGSAIATKNGTLIFVGPQGIGKSTLAAHFHRRGYTLLSDDVCAITESSDCSFRVLPAFPHMRLCDDAFERLSNISGTSTPARFDIDKYVVPLPQPDDCGIFPLQAVYLLTDRDTPDISKRQVQGFDSINLLLSNLYRLTYLPGFESRGDIMQMAVSIARKTPVYEILRPHDPERIEELIDTLETNWSVN